MSAQIGDLVRVVSNDGVGRAAVVVSVDGDSYHTSLGTFNRVDKIFSPGDLVRYKSGNPFSNGADALHVHNFKLWDDGRIMVYLKETNTWCFSNELELDVLPRYVDEEI